MPNSLLDKLLNGKTTSAGVVGILVVLGLQSLGVGTGRSQPVATVPEVKEILTPFMVRVEAAHAQQTNIEGQTIDVSKEMLLVLRELKDEVKELKAEVRDLRGR